jgi:hypothetical protein
MAIQIRTDQVQNNAITAGKIDLTGTFNFGSGTLQAGTPSNTTDVANKAYVDAQLPDAFSGGDGIAIATGSDPDVISVDLATDPGLQFSSNKLDLKLEANKGLVKGASGVSVKLKTETGGSISVDSGGLYIANSAIGNAKLANSTISGKALGANLDSLTDGNGIADFTFNGSGAASIAIDLDGSTLAVGGSGIKIADNGVGSGQIAGAAVSFAAMGFKPKRQTVTTNGSTAAFALTTRVPDADWRKQIMVFRNGLLVEEVASSASGSDQYVVSDDGSATTITFGAAPATSDNVRFMYVA